MIEIKIEDGETKKVEDLEITLTSIETSPNTYIKFAVKQDGVIVRFGGGYGDKFTTFKREITIKEPAVTFEITNVD